MRISDGSSDVCSSDLGDVSSAAKRLVRVAQEAMWKGIGQVRPGAHIGAIGFAIERHAKKNGYSIVREFCGHGLGREMHEEPQVMNFGRPGMGVRLREGMVLTIEQMINQGPRKDRKSTRLHSSHESTSHMPSTD